MYLEMAGFYRTWISGFGVIMKFLYKATQNPVVNTWSKLGNSKKKKTLSKLKRSLLSPLA
jgi:hypothetical protein